MSRGAGTPLDLIDDTPSVTIRDTSAVTHRLGNPTTTGGHAVVGQTVAEHDSTVNSRL
jgi:hypothetical protein